MKQELESVTQRKIMNAIRKHGGYVYKNPQSAMTEVGRPDLTACIPARLSTLISLLGEDAIVGLYCGLEVKRPGRQGQKNGGLSRGQLVVATQIEKANGIWMRIDDPALIEKTMEVYMKCSTKNT